jgi:hypothetical protein
MVKGFKNRFFGTGHRISNGLVVQINCAVIMVYQGFFFNAPVIWSDNDLGMVYII